MPSKGSVTVVLAVVLIAGFMIGSFAPATHAFKRGGTVKCQTELGTVIDAEANAGSFACADERSFHLDACIEDNVMYECRYRYHNGACDCVCVIFAICD